METIRRDWLKRQVAAGRVEAKCEMHLTDDYLYDAASNFGKTDWMQARLCIPKFGVVVPGERERCIDHDFIEGQMNLRESDFTGNCGRAYWENKEAGLIHLSVHGNLWYTLRLKQDRKAVA